MSKTLITGGCGFIGSALVKRLLEKGESIRVIDNCSRGEARRLKTIIGDLEFLQGDIRDKDFVNSSCKDVSKIHHLAYINGTKNFYNKPELVLDVATSGIINLYNACLNNNINEFLLASTSEVYQLPNNIPTSESERLIIPDVHNPRYTYGGGKILCELMTLHAISKIVNKVVVYRPHNVYGPDMGEDHVMPEFFRRLNSIKKTNRLKTINDFKIQGDGSETRSFIHINDFLDALLLLDKSGKNNNIYHIGNNDEVSIEKIANLIAKELHVNINIIPGELEKGSTKRRCPDISKISKLGYQQKVSLEKGISTLREWYT